MARTRIWTRSALLTLLAATAVTAGSVPARAGTGSSRAHSAGPVVHTQQGNVRGARAAGVESFLGIRYAEAPVGRLRWQPPQPPPRWHGVRPVLEFGNRCPALASTNGPQSLSEDCLFLNVWRPAHAGRRAHLPVLVAIHGGGLLNGSSNQLEGTSMVRQDGIIVVSFNYRLGPFGFLAHPALSAEQGESGNYGFEDQQAALRWVHRNIAAFGGDPRRVTINGESAGGWSVCGHLTSPGSRGLFSAAIIESGGCPSIPESQAEQDGTAFAASVGCTDAATAASCLRRTDVLTLLNAQRGIPSLASGTSSFPVAPQAAVTSGRFARVPLVIGANRDEGRTFAQGDIGWTQAQYVDWVKTTFPSTSAEVLARYPWPADANAFTAAYLVGAIMTDDGLLLGIGGCPNLALTQTFASYTRTWQYEFDHRTGPGLTPIPGYVWGAGHAAELAYLWPSFDNGTPIAPTFNAGERELARDMKAYWGAMVIRHAPRVRGLTPWPSYSRTGLILSLRAGGQSTLIPTAQYRAEHQCGFWDSINPAGG